METQKDIRPVRRIVTGLGQDQYDGLMLAIDQHGGKLGGQPVTVLKEDDQVKPETGVQIARKLIQRDQVDAIVGLGFTNVLMAQLPQIVESGVVAIATNSGARAISGDGCKPNIFATAWQSDGLPNPWVCMPRSRAMARFF